MSNFKKTKFLEELPDIDCNAIVHNVNRINTVVGKWNNIFSLVLKQHATLSDLGVLIPPPCTF